jgi:TNF receptor-associated protein 1
MRTVLSFCAPSSNKDSEREVFVRELISNASDALEKRRHQLADADAAMAAAAGDAPLEVQITADEERGVLEIADSGVGMTKQELVENLGVIAHSGTGEFLKQLEGKGQGGAQVIGQFGVGFYSAFMVGKRVEVYTRSSGDVEGRGHRWVSDGTGSYEISDVDGVARGTRVVIHLREDAKEFAQRDTIQQVVHKFSNFVNFDIALNGEPVNTVKALWTLPAEEVSEEQHKEFYQFIAHAYDTPTYRLMFQTDMPLAVQSVFYVPQQHAEKYGMGRQEPGVSLYSRRVLIQSKCAGLLPDWLRFVKGVVDSEDVPLNLSREMLQDSAVISRLNALLTRRLLKFLADQARTNEQRYCKEFFGEFGNFLKEGICTDPKWKEDIARLLRCETSAKADGELTSLDAYVERMPEHQKHIYFLCVPTRAFAQTSPYYEAFKKGSTEVLFLYTSLDDFVMNNLATYGGRKLVSIESGEVPLPPKGDGHDDDDASSSAQQQQQEGEEGRVLMDEEVQRAFSAWFKDTLAERVTSVDATDRLVDSPALLVDHESAPFRRMMKFVDPNRAPQLPKQALEFNPSHPIILGLESVRQRQPEIAGQIAEQVFDNALVAAGLLEDSRSMLPRINLLMQQLLESQSAEHAHVEDAEPTEEK